MAIQEKHMRLPTEEDGDENEHTPWLNQTNPKARSRMPTLVTFLVAAVVAVGILNALVMMSKREHQRSEAPSPYLWNYFLQSEHNSWKHPGLVERLYQDDDPDFQNKNLTIATENWSALYPKGEGIVGLTDQEVAEFGLHDSIRGWHDQSKRLYLVGAFHQLHCLGVLRSNTIKHYEDPSFSIASTFHHTMHCVDVLRQALMCAADSALIHKTEGMWPGDELITKCRNFDALMEWTKTHEYVPAKSEWVP